MHARCFIAVLTRSLKTNLYGMSLEVVFNRTSVGQVRTQKFSLFYNYHVVNVTVCNCIYTHKYIAAWPVIYLLNLNVQSDQKVSVHLMITVQKEVHRDFLIALYFFFLILFHASRVIFNSPNALVISRFWVANFGWNHIKHWYHRIYKSALSLSLSFF
jgi:hypothetical protein